MKKNYFLILIGLVLLLSGCAVSPYNYADNWVIRQNAKPLYFANYDLIYFYPEGIINNDTVKVNWALDRTNAEKFFLFCRYQTIEVFGNRVRVFCPFVRRIDCDTLYHDVDSSLQFYLDELHPKRRPFVIMGEGSGALTAYKVLLEKKKLSPENGLVAVILLNMPGGIPKELPSILTERGFALAHEDNLPGAIFGWSIGIAPEKIQGYGINPLNWRTNNDPATEKNNRGAVFLNTKTDKFDDKLVNVPYFCGARLDPETGWIKLLVPESSKRYLSAQYLKSSISPFAFNTRLSVEKRVREYLFRQQWQQ